MRTPAQPRPYAVRMQQRAFGRTGQSVSELGVGMWGMGGGVGGWTGADDRQSMAVLEAAVDAGVTFFGSEAVNLPPAASAHGRKIGSTGHRGDLLSV